MNHNMPQGVPELDRGASDIDVDTVEAFGQYVLIERVVKQLGAGLTLPDHLTHKNTSTMSIAIAVGSAVRGDLKPGDQVVFLNGAGIEQKGPGGGQLLIVHDTAIMLVDRSKNASRLEAAAAHETEAAINNEGQVQ